MQKYCQKTLGVVKFFDLHCIQNVVLCFAYVYLLQTTLLYMHHVPKSSIQYNLQTDKTDKPAIVHFGNLSLSSLISLINAIHVAVVHKAITHTQSHTFNGPMSGTTQVSRYQKGKTDLDFTGARDSEWQWHQLGHMQVCTSLQTDNHASTSLLSFLQARCPSCHPTNSVRVPSVL